MYLSIYVCIYVSMYHLLHVCHTLVLEIHVCPEIHRVFQYIDMLIYVIQNCTRLSSKEDRSYLCLL